MAERTPAKTEKRERQPQSLRERTAVETDGQMSGGVHSDLLSLQRKAGNQAVAGLMYRHADPQQETGQGAFHRAVLQRAPRIGFRLADTGAAATGQNAGKQDIGAIRRIPLSGIALGNQLPSMKNRYGGNVSTKESATGSAIVLLPSTLDPQKPVDVLLHLHGMNEGYRESGGKVRDVELDRIEQQMEASNRPQLIGILPQGTTKSEFGPQVGFNSDAYMDQVMDAIVSTGVWSSKPARGRVILSAHSGGGGAIGEKMLAGKDSTSAPLKMSELVLFDAINGPNETQGVVDWVKARLDHDLQELTKPNVSTADQAKYLDTSMRFRGYHTGPANATPNPSKDAGYANRYAVVQSAIDKWFQDHAAALGGAQSTLVTRLRSNYQVIASGLKPEEHDVIVGKGNRLLEAIQALPPLPASTSSTAAQKVSPQRSGMAPTGAARLAPPSVHAALSSEAEPLEADARALMESRFGHDFRDVHIHRDRHAEESAQALQARAFTVGQDIVFGAGEYEPKTQTGRQLLAHELSHVIQQQGARRYAPGESLEITPAHDASELEAAHIATRIGRAHAVHAVAPAIQRQPASAPLLDTRHPENAPTYEQWLATFANLPTFVASDTAPGGTHPSGFTPIGDRPASHDPKAPAADQPPPPTQDQPADHFIDRPTDAWVRANLPDNLREDAYRLPADCADIAVILRHVWLSAHHRTETYNGWVVGDLAGGPARERALGLIKSVFSGNVQNMVAAYSDDRGNPIRSFTALQNLLHPGDILVWEHHSGGLGTARTGGHTQTIVSVTRNQSGDVTDITVVQGNQPIFQPQAQEIRNFIGSGAPSEGSLREAPGRRVERTVLTGSALRDAVAPTKSPKLPPPPPVWTWGPDTTLVVAGPPRAAPRPAMQGKGAQRIRRLSDWIPALRKASAQTLEGTLEAALQEMRAQIEGAQAVSDDDARDLARAAGERLWQLSKKTSSPADPSFAPLQQMQMIEQIRAAIRGLAQGDTQATSPARNATQDRVRQVFKLVEDTFHLAARGATSVDFTRRVPRGTRIIRVLLTGFDPFNIKDATQPARPGDWNPSGAAVLALDGQTISVSRGVVAAVEGVVLPVNFDEFRAGLVERIVRPLASNVDAVITVSEDPSLAPDDPVRLERYAVGVHQLNNGALEAVPAAPGGSSGPAIIETPAPLKDIAADVARSPSKGQPAIPQPTIGTGVTLRFDSPEKANQALAALGQPQPNSEQAKIEDPVAMQQIISTMTLAANGTEINFRAGGKTFTATIQSGPGGNFLSNEVSYRVLRELGTQSAPKPTSFHVHTQRGVEEEKDVIPEGTDKDTLKKRRKALAAAAGIKQRLVMTLERIIRAVGERRQAP